VKRIVFAGAGHANIAALRRLAGAGVAAECVLVNDGAYAWYTGALPALLRGDIFGPQARLDVRQLAARCGALFVNASVVGFEEDRLLLDGHEPIGFDFLALSTGGVAVAGGVKPISLLLERVAALAALPRPRLGILGAGAAGAELALALRHRLGPGAEIFLGGSVLLPHAPERARDICARVLAAQKILLLPVLPEGVDDVLHAYTPVPDLRIEPTLLVAGRRRIFAAGDCALMGEELPRSGAIAVRQGRHLADNLQRALAGEALKDFVAPRARLAILSLGAGDALAWYGNWVWRGTLAARLKNWLDSRWLCAENG
jgi:selenide,water dikinase